MSQSPKRSVGRRRAAEKSEQKWKEAMEEEKTFEALPEVFLGTYINSLYSKKGVPDAKITMTKTKNIKNSELNNFEMNNHLNMLPVCSTNYTVLEDLVLKQIIKSVACGTCLSKKLEVSIFKNLSGTTEEISVNCTKCKTVTFKKNISTFSPKLPSSNDVEISDENYLNSKENIEQNKECDRRKKIVSLKPKESDLTKPIRPCFFCSKMQARLSRHVKTTHSNHPYVQNMLRQPKDVQAKMMRQLRSEGIFAENQRRIKAGRYDLLRIRNQGTGELSSCVYCKGYYKKKLLWRHKVTCIARFNKNNTEEKLLINQDTENGDLKNESLDPKAICVSESENIPNSADFIEDDKVNVPIQEPEVDPPEISKIKDILYGLEHGIFSQGEENVNGMFIKQEETDYSDLPDCQLGEKGQLNPVNNLQNPYVSRRGSAYF
ncbi:hypothetical protein Avbf_07408 [Armadillidium vulgare]|nr:hypothetical protein Avbf_07408 [Armadillidium vulgare]